MYKKIIIIIISFFNLFCIAQDNFKKVGLGIDFSGYFESIYSTYDFQPLEIYNISPSVLYNINEKSSMGFSLGYGHGSSVGEVFMYGINYKAKSNSINLAAFYQNRVINIKRFGVIIQTRIDVDYAKQLVLQNISIYETINKISNYSFNFKIGLDYRIFKTLRINGYISRDIISYISSKRITPNPYESTKWFWFGYSYINGIGIQYYF